MPNLPYERKTWTTLIFLGLLVPFVVVLAVMLTGEWDRKPQSGSANQSAATQAATTEAAATRSAPATTQPTESPEQSAITFAAGDGRTWWAVHPTVPSFDGKRIPGYELFASTNDGATWTAIRDKVGSGFIRGFPTGLALVGRPKGAQGHASACIFGEMGSVTVMNLNGELRGMPRLPGEELLAATGSENGVFALTLGTTEEAAASTQPDNEFRHPWRLGPATEEAAPTTTTAPATESATEPATQPVEILAKNKVVNLYGMRGQWELLAEMKGEAPTSSAKVALAKCGRRIIALWIDTQNPRELVARALDFHTKGATWSKAVRTNLFENPTGRLMPVTLDETVYLFWTAAKSTGPLEVHGGWLVTNSGPMDLTLPPRNMLPPMILDGAEAGAGLGWRDVSMAAVQNSLGIVVNGPDRELKTCLFDSTGRKLAGLAAMKLSDPRRDVQFAQNIAMLLLALMLTLSLWQWKQRPGAAVLPEGMVIASATLRGIAFLVDVGIAFFAMFVVYMFIDSDGIARLVTDLRKCFLNPELLLNSPEVLAFWGIYLAHVSVGELAFHRSIGKACVGIRVMMVDGKPPTLAAILVRNLIRLPELLVGILFVYFFISGSRQRLGDLVARTVVVGPKPPEIPEEKE